MTTVPRKIAHIRLVDGPAEGASTYYVPLPAALVIATKNPIRYHDYVRVAATTAYRHADNCDCQPKAVP